MLLLHFFQGLRLSFGNVFFSAQSSANAIHRRCVLEYSSTKRQFNVPNILRRRVVPPLVHKRDDSVKQQRAVESNQCTGGRVDNWCPGVLLACLG